MNFRCCIVFKVLVLGCFSISCSATKTEPPKPEPPKKVVEQPKLVGRIASIPAGRRFVLIQRYSEWEVEVGRILTTRGTNQRSANLRVTGESLGEFAAADLQSGDVEVGDAVYLQHTVKPSIPEVSPPPMPLDEAPGPENVQKNN